MGFARSLVFDFDSTLCDIETIDEIAKEINIQKQIESITAEAMNGRLSFFESLIKRVSLLKGTSKNPNNLDDIRFLSYSDFFKVRCSQSYIQFKKIAI